MSINGTFHHNYLLPQEYHRVASLVLYYLSSLSTIYLTLLLLPLPFYLPTIPKCVMTISSPQDSSLLQDDLNALANWSSAWKLAFNTSKCKLLRISPPNHTISTTSYFINQSTIDLTPSYRDLGVLVSDDLRWNDHYSTIIAKAYKSMYYVRRSTSNSHSTHTKLYLYKSLVRPKLLYCSQVWRPHLMKDIRLFESVQRRATKFILQDYHSSYKITLHLFLSLHGLNI